MNHLKPITVSTLVLCIGVGVGLNAHAQPLPRTQARRAGHDTIVTFGKPRIVKPRSRSGKDLSDHYGLTTEATLYTTEGGQPRQVAQLKIFTYNIAQIPSVQLTPIQYEGSRDAADNVDDIARHLNDAHYDIVCLQEAWAPLLVGGVEIGQNRARLIRSVSDYYPFHQIGPGPGARELNSDSGLLILSHLPILQPHHFMEFSEHSGGGFNPEAYAHKGILHARIQVGPTEDDTIDVFTTHTDSDSSDVRANQLAEIPPFIQRHKRDDHWIFTGDLNVNGATRAARAYTAMMDSLSHLLDLWTAFTQEEPTGYTSDRQNSTFRSYGDEDRGRTRLDYFMAPATRPSEWTHAGGACTPDETSATRYEAYAALFRHTGSITGNILARCNVTNPEDNGGSPPWNYLQVVYFDPFGTNQVTAELIRVSNRTGGISTVATFDSNTPGLTAERDAQTGGVFFEHVFDFDAYAYYVQMTVGRGEASAGNHPAVSIVRLKQKVE